MIIWENGIKHELSYNQVTALKALSIGYGHIRMQHGAILATFGLCYVGVLPDGYNGYIITASGRRCLEVWEAGGAYNCTANDRRGSDRTDRALQPEPEREAE